MVISRGRGGSPRFRPARGCRNYSLWNLELGNRGYQSLPLSSISNFSTWCCMRQSDTGSKREFSGNEDSNNDYSCWSACFDADNICPGHAWHLVTVCLRYLLRMWNIDRRNSKSTASTLLPPSPCIDLKTWRRSCQPRASVIVPDHGRPQQGKGRPSM